MQRVTVVVALDLGTGNTKNLEYENEERAIRLLIEYRDTCQKRVSLFFIGHSRNGVSFLYQNIKNSGGKRK